jgi:hypothetical protein
MCSSSASGAPDHSPRATLEINDQLGARAESPESLRRTAHPKPVTRAKFTREVQKPLGIGVQSQQEKPCGARRYISARNAARRVVLA